MSKLLRFISCNSNDNGWSVCFEISPKILMDWLRCEIKNWLIFISEESISTSPDCNCQAESCKTIWEGLTNNLTIGIGWSGAAFRDAIIAKLPLLVIVSKLFQRIRKSMESCLISDNRVKLSRFSLLLILNVLHPEISEKSPLEVLPLT